jgi:hypothetical protein
MKLSKTALRIIRLGRFVVSKGQSRLIKAMTDLESAGLVTVEKQENDYGHYWFIVTTKN